MERALFRILTALAKTLLRVGINYPTFDNLARCAYVMAAKQRRPGGTPANTSQIAARTGLSRKIVKRVLDERVGGAESEPLDNTRSITCLAYVLSTWFHSVDYQDVEGKPKALQVGDTENGFDALVRSSGKDIPAGAVLRELLHVGAVEEFVPGWVRILRQDYAPVSTAQYEERFGEVLEDFITTVSCNLLWEGQLDQRLREQRVIERIDRRHVEEFRVFSRVVLEQANTQLNNWMVARKKLCVDPDSRQVRVGYGVYAISDARAEECGFR